MSNRLRHYRRSMIRAAAEAKGGKLFYRGAGRKVTEEPSRLSAALHKARGTKPKYVAPKRGTDVKKPTAAAAAEKKRGLSSVLLDALRRRRAQ